MEIIVENQENNRNLENTVSDKIIENSLETNEKECNNKESEIITTNEEITSKISENGECDSSDEEMFRRGARKNVNVEKDDDSDDEESSSTNLVKKRHFIDSDSEDDLDSQKNLAISPHEKSFSTKTSSIDECDEENVENTDTGTDFSKVRSRLKDLCDSDSSENEEIQREDHTEACNEVKKSQKSTMRSKRPQTKEEKPVKMTGKDVAKLKTEIQSESQRMARTANVSLPYHKPKPRTLQEFLTRRPKLASAVEAPAAIPAPLAIKMRPEQLADIALKIKEREKQLKEFYKSESESEDGDDEDYVPENSEKNDEPNNTENPILNPVDEVLENKENEENNLVTETEEEVVKNYEISEPTITEDSPVDTITSNSEIIPDIEEENCVITEEINENVPLEEENQSETEQTTETIILEPEIPKDSTEELKSLKRIDLIKASLPNIEPKLSGGPNDVIDLETGVTKPNEICKLKERFIKHTANSEKHKDSVRLNVLSVTGGEVHKETLAVSVQDEEDLHKIEEKPLVRYKKLRTDLKNQIDLKRTEYWKQKNTEMLENKGELEEDSEEKKSDYENDVLDIDEEEDLTETEEETDDEEYIENDVDLKEKPRTKSDFIDEEAEESDKENGEESDNIETESNCPSEPNKKKKLRRIINKFQDDSDEENPEFEASKSNYKFESTMSELSSVLPPHNLFNRTPNRPQIDYKTDLSCLTPISFASCVQNLNSETKSLTDSPIISPMLFGESPYKKHIPFQSSLQKKLTFSEDSQENSKNLDDIPATSDILQSGTFPPTTQDILNVCSGTFADSQLVQTQDNIPSPTQREDSIRDDLLISQILEEDEIEQSKLVASQNGEIQGGGVIDSDDDEDEVLEVKKRKNRRQVALSDDESDLENNENDEEIDLHDDFDSDEEDVPPKNICYDSEENEIEMEETDVPSAALKAIDFVEQEAELSESEWGSEDEDEKGLDDFEEEVGDTENYDEEKVRTDIERIHMRRLLDDDNREVKLLQELLLEDGELHGTGRQRQFKWKNIDAMDEENEKRGEDDEALLDEEETEEEFRKRRYQRELFLKSNSQKCADNDDDDEDLVNNQLFKITQRLIEKKTSISTIKSNEDQVTSLNEPFNLLSKRGSFLSKGDNVLERLAHITKEQSSVTVGAAKNSRNFLFQTVSSKQQTSTEKKKRKAVDTTSNVNKKSRFNSNTKSVNKKSLYTNNNW